MSKISAVIIVKNGEKLLVDCIDSLKFVDEIIIIDNGSTDRTVELAQLLKAQVFTYTTSDFSALRNYGLRKAKGNWILYVDVDERVSGDLAVSIRKVTEKRESKYNAYWIKRQNFYFGNHKWPTSEKLERLFKKKALEEWYGELHESPRVKGEIGELEGYLLHYTHRDLTSMVEKTIRWSAVEAKLRFDAKHPPMTWWRFPRVMITTFYHYYVSEKGYKAGTAGLIESIYQTFSIFITYARLWELQMAKPEEAETDR